MIVSLSREEGKGRPCIVVCDESHYRSLVDTLVSKLSESERVLVVNVTGDLHSSWRTALDELRTILVEQKVRNASYVGIGSGGSIAIQQAIENAKEVRRLAVINGTTRPQPSLYEKCLDYCESSLPLGLPFKKNSQLFDAKPYLQRVRCPVLVMTTSSASLYERAEADRMLQRFPSAWSASLGKTVSDQEIDQVIDVFLGLDPKCPQKGNAKLQKAAV